MSNGSGPIIINSLVESPETTVEEKDRLKALARKSATQHSLNWFERRYVKKIVDRILK